MENSSSSAPSAAGVDPNPSNNVGAWWLDIDNQTLGPHSYAYISSLASSDGVAATTLACRVGERQWRPLQDWPEFATLFSQAAPRDTPSDSMSPDHRWWNRSLPLQARLLAIYLLIVQPTLTLLWVVSDLTSGGIPAQTQDQILLIYLPVYDYLQSAALSVLAAATGWQVLYLWRSAFHLVPMALGTSAARSMLSLVAIVIAFAYSLTLPQDLAQADEPLSGAAAVGMALSCLLLPLSLAALAFEIYGFIWWLQHAKSISWPSSPFTNPGRSK